MKRIFFYTAIIALSFISCNQDEIFTERDNGRTTVSHAELLNEVFSADREADMLRPFARALYGAMSESPMLRELIRTHALEKFNREYDVLYQFIKGELVENGLTVRQLLLQHFESEEALAYIERNRPTLTIFVPRLPEDSFSAETWNTGEEVPLVALHVTRHIYTPIIGDFGEYGNEFLIESRMIPAFPVVALRNNPRVRVVTDGRPSTRSAVLDNPNSDFVFEFTDPYFDGSKIDESIATRQATTNVLDATVQRAFQIFPNDAAGWQRDYIYYGITPASPNGRFSRNFKEHITSFRFLPTHTPQQMFNHIANHRRDPALNIFHTAWVPSLMPLPPHPWTAGNFTFRVNIQMGTTSPHLSQFTQPFIASPEQLFEVTFLKGRVLLPGPRMYILIPQITGFRTMENLRIPLINWNLAQFEPMMRISIAKENPYNETVTNTVTHEVEFATNVNMDFKFGMRFGATARDRTTVTSQIATRTRDVELGTTFVHFGDMVVLGQQGNTWRLREHHSSMFAITVQPLRVQ